MPSSTSVEGLGGDHPGPASSADRRSRAARSRPRSNPDMPMARSTRIPVERCLSGRMKAEAPTSSTPANKGSKGVFGRVVISRNASSTPAAMTRSTSTVMRGWPRSDTARPPIRAPGSPRASSIAIASASVGQRRASTLDLVESVKGGRHAAALGERFAPCEIVDRLPVARAFVGCICHTKQILDDGHSVCRRQRLGPCRVARPRERAETLVEQPPPLHGSETTALRRITVHDTMIPCGPSDERNATWCRKTWLRWMDAAVTRRRVGVRPRARPSRQAASRPAASGLPRRDRQAAGSRSRRPARRARGR